MGSRSQDASRYREREREKHSYQLRQRTCLFTGSRGEEDIPTKPRCIFHRRETNDTKETMTKHIGGGQACYSFRAFLSVFFFPIGSGQKSAEYILLFFFFFSAAFNGVKF